MRSRKFLRLALCGVLVVAVAGCNAIRRQAGLTKQAPDEFAVVTKAPLIIPPNFNLQPPAPGAPPLNQQDPTSSAQTALFSSDPATVAAGMPATLSLSERMMLANARAQTADPAIRAQLQAEARSTAAAADRSFTDRVLGGALTSSPKPATAKATAPAAPAKTSGGWFDWF